ncbi:MAG: glycerol-3-phosphate 1-O-acyltransferase PlsY [Cyclobacteriaceae bacterium]
MTTLLLLIIGLLISYLLGSFSSAVWFGKLAYKIDIREYGSGNAGATNTFRVLGKKAGSVVMLLDTLKGYLASSLPLLYFFFTKQESFLTESQLVLVQLACGIIAVTGHVFPVFFKFKGGKGVATLLGVIFAIHLEVALVCFGIFIAVLLLSKYVSLGSMIAAFSFPILVSFDRFHVDTKANIIMSIFGIAIFFIVVLTHQKNIRRLLTGTENKANIRLKKNR